MCVCVRMCVYIFITNDSHLWCYWVCILNTYITLHLLTYHICHNLLDKVHTRSFSVFLNYIKYLMTSIHKTLMSRLHLWKAHMLIKCPIKCHHTVVDRHGSTAYTKALWRHSKPPLARKAGHVSSWSAHRYLDSFSPPSMLLPCFHS
jgi:hypothetical protein